MGENDGTRELKLVKCMVLIYLLNEEREEASSPKARWPQDTRACALPTTAKPLLALRVAMQSVLFVESTCRQGEMLSCLGDGGYE